MRRIPLLLVLALGAAACAPGDAVEPSIVATTETTTATTVTTADVGTTTTSEPERRVTQSPEGRARDLAYVEDLSAPALGSGLPAITRSFDIEVADLNGDGHDDIIFASHQNRKVVADSWDGFWV